MSAILAGMETHDARSLPVAKAQEALRLQGGEAAVRNGMTQTEGRSHLWAGAGNHQRLGEPGQAARCADSARRRRRGASPAVALGSAPGVFATAVRMVLSGCPDQMNLPFALWTRRIDATLLSRKFGVAVSVWTAGRYLRAWGLIAAKTSTAGLRTGSCGGVRKWLEQEYLATFEESRRGATSGANSLVRRDGDCGVRTIKRDDPTDETRANTCGLGDRGSVSDAT